LPRRIEEADFPPDNYLVELISYGINDGIRIRGARRLACFRKLPYRLSGPARLDKQAGRFGNARSIQAVLPNCSLLLHKHSIGIEARTKRRLPLGTMHGVDG
jgi:hypothetical protein